MDFEGMDPDAGRELAERIRTAGTDIQDRCEEVGARVSAVEWTGPDHDSYLESWSTFQGGRVQEVIDAFATRAQEIQEQADQQEETSRQE